MTDTFAVRCIYCNMEKIIGIFTVQESRKKNRLRKRAKEILCVPWPLLLSTGVFLDIPVEGYGIRGPGDDDMRLWQQMQETGAGKGETKEKQSDLPAPELRKRKRQQRRMNGTIRHIRKAMCGKYSGRSEGQRREVRDVTYMSEKAFLFYSWQEELFPTELMLAFYRHCHQENLLVFRAEQLIFAVGEVAPQESGEAFAWGMSGDPYLTVMEGIYDSFNYVTIITEREAAWQGFIEEAYEEYGLSVRCVRDESRVTFREKKTLIVDMSREGSRCMGNFPPQSVYLDMMHTKSKSRRIAARCDKIPYISLHNALDTVLRDGV